MRLEGSSALVTGAGRGIGRAVALALGRRGARVTAVARTASEIEAVASEIRGRGGEASAVPADLRRPGAARTAVDAAVQAHGGLDVLVNNAGVGGRADVADTSDEMWADILETNLGAVFRLTRAALPHLAERGGHLFMISSLAGSNAIAGMAAYCASKAALDHFAHCLMLEVRHRGIKVTTIAPGSVDTAFGTRDGLPRLERDWMLTPDDVADAVVQLLGTRPEAHLSRVEMRPLRPQKRM